MGTKFLMQRHAACTALYASLEDGFSPQKLLLACRGSLYLLDARQG